MASLTTGKSHQSRTNKTEKLQQEVLSGTSDFPRTQKKKKGALSFWHHKGTNHFNFDQTKNGMGIYHAEPPPVIAGGVVSGAPDTALDAAPAELSTAAACKTTKKVAMGAGEQQYGGWIRKG